MRAQQHINVSWLDYSATPSLRSSDHRPVGALLLVELPLPMSPFDAPMHAYQILLYDIVVEYRRASDVLRAVGGEAPASPASRLLLRVTARCLQDKPSLIAVAPQLQV